ncbi:hypothetical protein [Acinetobacter tjernbergiae]|uniref:Uncharacterized protein n=1 Tax=Acinetobacter tjernbergiae DSM 14971 = CIP 107465 TaxID=1120928 RepID=V2UKM5_9GAMM|nr:hypothetical protein [Acinetobacter tjernbergiae]ESK55263.1 hypothetical protein F990_02052 [Acinetobacter tjernbergiae DSM 14971 = CIP 107465]
MNIKQKIIYGNSTIKDIRLVVEPWGREFILEPNSNVDIIIEGNIMLGCLEIESNEEGLIIYGWAGSIISIYQNGIEVC